MSLMTFLTTRRDEHRERASRLSQMQSNILTTDTIVRHKMSERGLDLAIAKVEVSANANELQAALAIGLELMGYVRSNIVTLELRERDALTAAMDNLEVKTIRDTGTMMIVWARNNYEALHPTPKD